MRETKVAVVGLGPGGITTTVKLASKWLGDETLGALTLDCFERAEVVAGSAFSGSSPHHILNMPAHSLRIHDRAPSSFSALVPKELLSRVSTAEYGPRSEFGSYLSAVLNSARMACENESRIDINVHMQTPIVSVNPLPDGKVRLQFDERFSDAYDIAIVAVGAEPSTPKYPSDIRAYELEVSEIDPDGSVAVLGSSLTAVDAIVSLTAGGHRGEIVVHARTRTLPGTRPRAGLTDNEKLDLFSRLMAPETSDIVGLARVLHARAVTAADYKHQRDRILHPWQRPLADLLEDDLRHHRSGAEQVHSVLDATSPYVPELWRRLPVRQREQFLYRYASRWAMVRHSIPEANACRLHAAAVSGQLDAVKLVGRDSRGLLQSSRGRGSARVGRHFDHIIDARGLELHARIPALLRPFEDHGLIASDPLGGVLVDWATARATPSVELGGHSVYVLGALTRGSYFYVNSVETIVATADRITTDVVRRQAKKFRRDTLTKVAR